MAAAFNTKETPMALQPEIGKGQDKPQQARQQLKRKDRAHTPPSAGQGGKQPVPGDYDDELESEEGSPEAEPSRPK
jgi:hypothetical protein